MTDIGIIKGAIELQDDFTSQLGLAKAALQNFSKENQESLKAVAGAAGLVVAAFSAVAVGTIALANRGADINDLTATVEHFAGGANEAKAAMDALREGTLNTVDNFTLAQKAAHLLSAGVKLTAEDFGTLGSAAFVLQNRGLGDTKTQLDLVSDALVTGRTKALAMALGVIDVGDAEANYAKQLGITKDQLSDTGKAESHRIAIMGMLSAAVKDAGAQERDFGEQLEAARTFATNFVDELASALGSSEVFAVGMREVGKAVSDAFSGDKTEAIEGVVGWIEKGAIVGVDFGLATIEMARVVNVAWSAVKTIVLGVVTGISAGAELVLAGITSIAGAAESLNILPEGSTAQLEEFRVQLRGMTSDLDAQTQEAAKGIIGQSDFDKTLDKLGGTLFTVRDAMVEASKTSSEYGEATDVAASNSQKLADIQAQVAKSMIDRAKVEEELIKIEKKSIEETIGLWADYAAQRVKNTGTSEDYARAQIQATFDKQVAALDELDRNYDEHYAAIKANATEALAGVESDWDKVKDKSIDALQQTADRARRTYEQMVSSGKFFRNELDAQLAIVRQTADDARGMGQAFQEAYDAAAEGAKEAAAQQEELNKKLEAEKEARRTVSYSFDINRSNLGAMATSRGISPELAFSMAKRGFSFTEMLAAIKAGMENEWIPQGPRIAGFGLGGTVDIKVGENGPEAIRVPLGTQVFPTGMEPGSRNNNVTLIFNVNGTAEESAHKIKKILMRDYTSNRNLSFAG